MFTSKEIRLLRRLENNLASYHKLVKAYKKRQIIQMAGSIAERQKIFRYLTDVLFELEQADIDLLLCFDDPLAMVNNLWHKHQAAMCGYEDVLDFLADVYGDYDEDFDGEDDFFSDWEDDDIEQ